MDSRLARALSYAAHDILSSNSTIKTMSALLNNSETSKVILEASAKIHRLANELRQFAAASESRAEPSVVISGCDLAAMASHRFGVRCAYDESREVINGTLIYPHKLRQTLDLLGGLIDSAHMRVKSLQLSAGEHDGTKGFSLAIRLDNEEMLEDTIALLLCEALLMSMRGKFHQREGQIELFMPGNAR